jgi:hypothetical protein
MLRDRIIFSKNDSRLFVWRILLYSPFILSNTKQRDIKISYEGCVSILLEVLDPQYMFEMKVEL